MSEWVSVKDRLPFLYEPVMTFDKDFPKEGIEIEELIAEDPEDWSKSLLGKSLDATTGAAKMIITQRRHAYSNAERRESRRAAVLIAIVFLAILCSGSIESIPM